MERNLQMLDRYIRLAGGILLFGAATAMKRRAPVAKAALLTLGAMKIAEGITGWCPILQACGVRGSDETTRTQNGQGTSKPNAHRARSTGDDDLAYNNQHEPARAFGKPEDGSAASKRQGTSGDSQLGSPELAWGELLEKAIAAYLREKGEAQTVERFMHDESGREPQDHTERGGRAGSARPLRADRDGDDREDDHGADRQAAHGREGRAGARSRDRQAHGPEDATEEEPRRRSAKARDLRQREETDRDFPGARAETAGGRRDGIDGYRPARPAAEDSADAEQGQVLNRAFQ